MKKLFLLFALALSQVAEATTVLSPQGNSALTVRRNTSTNERTEGVYLSDTDGNPIGLSVTVSGGFVKSVSLTAQGTPANVGFVSDSSTAQVLAAYLTVSDTVRTVSSTDVPLAITSLAGSATGMYRFEFSTLGPCAGIYWATNATNAAPPVYHFSALSATALADVDLAAGEHLHFLRGSASDCTTKIVIKKRTAQAP